MCDKLGHSQILPYLLEINKNPKIKLFVISFEKSKNLEKVKELFKKKDIKWYPLNFTHKFIFFVKIIDLIKVIFYPILLHLNFKFSLVHCRGHLPAISGYIFKKFFNKKFIFDCRGLWADERIDNKSWNQEVFFYRTIYNLFKFLERKFFIKSDGVVVLTKKLKKLLISKNLTNKNKISVIPCVADFDKFNILSDHSINKFKKIIGLSKNDLIVGYFGSISNIYSPEQMINFFIMLKKEFKNPKIIFVSDNFDYLFKNCQINLFLSDKDYFLVSPTSDELIYYYNICDFTLSFVVDSFARIASFPTKVAESLACGTPVISNYNVGDLNYFIAKYYKNGLVKIKIKSQLKNLSKKVHLFKALNKKNIREKSKFELSLKIASQKYNLIYDRLLK